MKLYASPQFAAVSLPLFGAQAQQKAVTIGVMHNPDIIELKRLAAMGFHVIA